ncbi:MAG: HK97 family phage prohead protease [Isosphaeraceae bacterium]|nr:HK97 family phage prohead protease [Isosphaeraceae bacterium]
MPRSQFSSETPQPGSTSKHFTPAEINFTPGERSFVAWISLDVVDNEGDVVVPSGVDFESVYMGVKGDPRRPGNPVVMAVHDYQRWPLGTCEWIKVARPSKRLNFSGLYSKTLIDEDPDALKVFGMIQRRVVRGISIGFRPPENFQPGEWGPPTHAELLSRPDWATARRIIRRCVLLEYSVVPIPMNQGALIVAVSKGLELPTYLQDKVKPMPVLEDPDNEVPAPEEPVACIDEAELDAVPQPIRKGDYVKWQRHPSAAAGCGKVVSIHRAGKVPGVLNDVEGTAEMPAARVQVYKSMDDPHRFHESDDHVGVHLHRCQKMDSLGFVAGKTAPPYRTQAQWLASVERLARERLAAESPGADALVREAMERVYGAI